MVVRGDSSGVDLARLCAVRSPRNGVYPTVVVDGRAGSGKSTLADLLRLSLPGFVVLNGDDYFEAHDHPITWGGFNEERFNAEVLSPLREGNRTINLRPFNYSLNRVEVAIDVPVVSGVIVERCFGFRLDVDWDVRIWVETPSDICLARGIERDTSDLLGERVRLAWETVWQPDEDHYIAQCHPQQLADLVLDGTTSFADQLDLAP